MNNFLVSLCIFNTYCQNWFHLKFLSIKDACLSSDQTQQEFKHFSKKTNLIFHKREKPPLQPKSSLPYIYILIYKILKFAKLAKSKIKTRERAACHGRKSKIPRILKREDGRRGKRHNARNVMEGGGWVSRFPCKCIDARATIGRSARGALTILSSPILPYKRDKRRRKGMVSVDNGSNSIAPDIHSSRMQRRSFGRARRGEKKAGSPVSIFCDGRPLAPFMNILEILMRFQTTILVHGFGPPSSSSRAAVVLVVDVSASLGTPTQNVPQIRQIVARILKGM